MLPLLGSLQPSPVRLPVQVDALSLRPVLQPLFSLPRQDLVVEQHTRLLMLFGVQLHVVQAPLEVQHPPVFLVLFKDKLLVVQPTLLRYHVKQCCDLAYNKGCIDVGINNEE